MIPPFKIAERPPSDMEYTQVTHVDAHGRTIWEFQRGDLLKSVINPLDRFIGVDRAEAHVSTPQGEGVAGINLRFPIKAVSVRQAFVRYDEAAQAALTSQLEEMRKQELAAGGRIQFPFDPRPYPGGSIG